MVRNPAVFLLDEPLSNLDAKLRTAMRSEISRLHKRLQTTFVYVTHDQTEAMTMGDRIVVMKDGIIQQNDTPQNLYDFPCNLFVAGFIGSPQMNFIDAALDKYVGKTVVLGIRPEDVIAGDGDGIAAKIDIAELMGAEINLYLDCQGVKLIARTPSTFRGRENDIAKFALKTEKIHLFDKETELAICH